MVWAWEGNAGAGGSIFMNRPRLLYVEDVDVMLMHIAVGNRCVVPGCARFIFTPRIAGAAKQAGAVLLSHVASLGGACGTTPLKQPQQPPARPAGTR